MTTAVVLGGGFAGVLAATVLARRVDAVTIVEGGGYPVVPGSRPGLPQGHHSHVLAAGGALALEALLPGTLDALIASGAHHRDLPGQALICSAQGWFRRQVTGAYVISASRWLIDQVIRERALTADVALRQRTRALGLVGDAKQVVGVAVRDEWGRAETIRADLVVDATGRGSQAPRWLGELGGPSVPEDIVDPGLAYATRIYQAPADLTAALPAIMLHPGPGTPRPGQGATLFPIEDDRWVVTLTGIRGSEPPCDEDGFAAFARELRCPIIADLIAAAEPVTSIRACHSTANRRRYFERTRRPDGFLVLGDALAAVNPVYSHGMSVAASGAVRLARELDRCGTDPRVLPGIQLALAEEVERSWQLATDQDRGRSDPRPVVRQPDPGGASRGVPDGPVLVTELFRAQLLLPKGVLADGALVRELATPARPALSTDDAVGQYPQLFDWWSAHRRGAADVLTGRKS